VFWALFLSHLLGDFPLQPMWLVRSKAKIWGLALHGGIHFLTLLLLVGTARSTIWPQITTLALFHFLVDVGKYRLAIARPTWVTLPYFVDQAVHIVSLVITAAWIGSIAPDAVGLVEPQLAVYISGYLIATHVWFVTEKTVTHSMSRYNREVEMSLWPRMLVRALLLAGLLFVGTGVIVTAVLLLPYQKGTNWRRALITDIVVTSSSAALIGIASGSV
jgi:hypothetical protein